MNHNELDLLDHDNHAPRVVLSQLHTLYIRGKSSGMAVFLGRTSFEQATNIFVSYSDALQNDEYRRLQPWILGTSNSKQAMGLYIRSLDVASESGDSTYRARVYYGNQTHLTLEFDRLGPIIWPLGADNSSFINALFTLFPSGLLSHCTSFQTTLPLMRVDWEVCERSLECVENIQLKGRKVKESGKFMNLVGLLECFLDPPAMGVDAPNSSSVGTETRTLTRTGAVMLLPQSLPSALPMTSPLSRGPYFPALTSLRADYECVGKQWETLKNVLKKRKARGIGIRTLTIGFGNNWSLNVLQKVGTEICKAGLVQKLFAKDLNKIS